MSKKLGLIMAGGGVIVLVVGSIWWGRLWWMRRNLVWVKPEAETGVPEKITELEKYKFENLARKVPEEGEIKLERVLKAEENYTSYLFAFETEGKRVTGWANIPGKAEEQMSLRAKEPENLGVNELKRSKVEEQDEKYPVILMIRGYVDKEIYQTGVGTYKAAGVLADNGYVTLAPDFLGYGESDEESEYPLAARFERPLTVLNLLAAIKSWPMADTQRVGIWAHSNGGQIALSVLEITREKYPTTLWAPVSIGFPESILNYTDELPDKGEYLKGIVKEFEVYYLPERFSIDNYWSRIQAPIQIHQGTGDEEVPVEWSRELANRLKSQAEIGVNNEIIYWEYPDDDHNFTKGNWAKVVGRDVEFFGKMLK